MSVKNQTVTEKIKQETVTTPSTLASYQTTTTNNKLEQHKVPSRVQGNTDSKELHRVPLRAPEDKVSLPELHRVPLRVL